MASRREHDAPSRAAGEPVRDDAAASGAGRRDFLRALAAAGAVGAGCLALPPQLLAAREESALGRLLSWRSRGTAAGTINMVCLGDSILWGQGLADSQKYQTIVANWIQENDAKGRGVQRWNFAHSGASIARSSHTFVHQTTKEMRRQLQQRLEGGRVRELPEIDPVLLRDSLETEDESPPSSSTYRGEPKWGDALGGEIPRTYPTLWRQLEMAKSALAAGEQPGAKGARRTPVNPADVQLVLLSGGANDIGFIDTVLKAEWSAADVTRYATSLVQPRMERFLPAVLEAFPNATVVMTGYYRGISRLSSAAAWDPVVKLIRALSPVGGAAGAAVDMGIPGAIARMDAFESTTTRVLQQVARAKGQGRTLFVSPQFAPENAYGAPKSFIFHLEETDPAERVRRQECKALWDQQHAAFRNERHEQSWVAGLICDDASMFHPNAAGAQRYADRIIASLKSAKPAWLDLRKPLRIAVKGSGVPGPVKVITVTAVDAATGKPVEGTVKINGVTGKTGTPIRFRACGVVEDQALPRGPVTTRPRAGSACEGTVTAPGYLEAKFQH